MHRNFSCEVMHHTGKRNKMKRNSNLYDPCIVTLTKNNKQCQIFLIVSSICLQYSLTIIIIKFLFTASLPYAAIFEVTLFTVIIYKRLVRHKTRYVHTNSFVNLWLYFLLSNTLILSIMQIIFCSQSIRK